MRDVILDKLKQIEIQENVKILYAVESGSRAWGFASPDSDYDVRFIYLRNTDSYLALNPIKDTINYELNEVYDINGWDLTKALKLLYKSNPTLYEWQNSPIVYKKNKSWELMDKAFEKYFQPVNALHHYYHMTLSSYSKPRTLKYYFYTLRTLLSCLWIIKYQSAPPIELEELLFLLSEHLYNIVEEMIETKKKQNEKVPINDILELNEYIEEKLNFIQSHLTQTKKDLSYDILNKTFIDILRKENEKII